VKALLSCPATASEKVETVLSNHPFVSHSHSRYVSFLFSLLSTNALTAGCNIQTTIYQHQFSLSVSTTISDLTILKFIFWTIKLRK
jgi:hypothetical protein